MRFIKKMIENLDLCRHRWSDRLPLGGERAISDMHPHDRLNRNILGERACRERDAVVDLFKRDKPLAETRTSPGESLKARSCEIKYRRVPYDPGPNSPLLKRIVKYPYAMDDIGRPKRTVIPMGLSSRQKRESFPRLMAMFAVLRGERTAGGPLKALSIRPVPIQRAPSVDVWLGERGNE